MSVGSCTEMDKWSKYWRLIKIQNVMKEGNHGGIKRWIVDLRRSEIRLRGKEDTVFHVTI